MLILSSRMGKRLFIGLLCFSSCVAYSNSWAEFSEQTVVNITSTLSSIQVMHEGEPITVMRHQSTDHTITPLYAKTSRKCPPFCIQPLQLAEGVATIGELELLEYMQQLGQGDVLLIDSRTPEWLLRGTIPGAINIPWMVMNPELSAAYATSESDAHNLETILTTQFNATQTADGQWDFSQAKILILFCNGIWCPQSPTNIATLLKFGYPAAKLKWYRGGMQDWMSLGLTTVTPQP